jgi:hypothetical protein
MKKMKTTVQSIRPPLLGASFPETWLYGVGCLYLRQILLLFFTYKTKVQNHSLPICGLLNPHLTQLNQVSTYLLATETSYSFFTYAILSPLYPCASHVLGCSALVNGFKITEKKYREPEDQWGITLVFTTSLLQLHMATAITEILQNITLRIWEKFLFLPTLPLFTREV